MEVDKEVVEMDERINDFVVDEVIPHLVERGARGFYLEGSTGLVYYQLDIQWMDIDQEPRKAS